MEKRLESGLPCTTGTVGQVSSMARGPQVRRQAVPIPEFAYLGAP